ncbi:putative phage abortive infection protein [Acinetobacter johnsonii]|uniref:Phage abortive infection protein n=1 Tax=Acinetobacter johnsonii TaxID=40214 RepID=A0A1R7QCH5_ACIJO|nr:putative phage abortive infection protein [Acinetobacter johnsonii]SJX21960.1 hypothetical protein ACNJC6_01589 [Acinetobacter johnsonii]
MSFLKRYWFFLVVILGIFIIQIYFYFNTFGVQHDFKVFFWENLADKKFTASEDDGLEGKWGAFGDYMGGILNPVLGFITIVLLLISHYKDGERDNEYQKQREVDLFLSRLENLKISQYNNIQNIRVIKKNGDGKFEDYVVLGNIFFSVFFNILNRVFLSLKDEVSTDEDKLRIAYLVIYYGMESYSESISKKYNHLINCNKLEKLVLEIRDDMEEVYGLLLFNGFRTQLSSYFRGLYHIMGVIENSQLISEKEKYELSKDIRIQMSPQEQIILLVNSLTENGEKWNTKGYCVIFKLFRNVNAKEYFRDVDLSDIVYRKIDNYDVCNSNKLKKYQFREQDLDSFKKNYFEII